MARQKGIHKINGTLDELTYYTTEDGDLVRTKSSLDADRIARDPAFQRTRENAAEFRTATKAATLLYRTLQMWKKGASDEKVMARFTSKMREVLNFDTESTRGDRLPAIGLATEAGKACFKGFNLNKHTCLQHVMLKPLILDKETGVICIPSLIPTQDMVVPKGTTHVRLTGACVHINFGTSHAKLNTAPPILLELGKIPCAVETAPIADTLMEGITLYLLKIEVLQYVNGQAYSLNDGKNNALAIIDIQ